MQEQTLFDLSQARGAGELHDAPYMTVSEKAKVIRHWEAFLRSGLQKSRFTKALYHHLINHCSFIAHYDINGFYSTYFERGDDTVRFLSQFDGRKGLPRSIEYGYTGWLTGEEFYDINSEMVRIAGKYIRTLVDVAKLSQKVDDIERAKHLLAKHGISLPEE